MDKGYKNEMKD